MAKISKKTAILITVISCVVLIAGIKLLIDYSRGNLNPGMPARAKGNTDAVLKISEFIDFQCPMCATSSLFLSKYIEKYPERIYLEIKYYPLGRIHKHAYRSAHFAQCAAEQNKFWPYHDLLMERQKEWARLDNADPAFDKIAAEVGLKRNALDACLASDEIRQKIIDDRETGSSLGIKSTPSYFINDELVVGIRKLKEIIIENFGNEEG